MNGEPNSAATYAEALNTGAAATISHAVKPTQAMTSSHVLQRQYGKPASTAQTQIVSVDGQVVYTESFPEHTPFKAV